MYHRMTLVVLCVQFIFMFIYSTFFRELTYFKRLCRACKSLRIVSVIDVKGKSALCIYLTVYAYDGNTDHYRAWYHYMCGNWKPSYLLFRKTQDDSWELFYKYIGLVARFPSRFASSSHRIGTISSNEKPLTRTWISCRNYSRIFPQNPLFEGIFFEYGKSVEGEGRCEINATGIVSSVSRRVLREVRTRENCREYRSEGRVCVPSLVYRPRYLVAPTYISSLQCYTYSWAAVQSNLELSLSSMSRVLGRYLRSGFTSFLRQTADITGGKRRMRYRREHREVQIQCLRNLL